MKNKKIGLDFQISHHRYVPKMFLNLTSTPKIALKSPKIAKRPKIWPNEKQKDRAVLPKQNLIVDISRFQNVFEPDLDPKNSPIGQKKPEEPKKCKRGPKYEHIKNK